MFFVWGRIKTRRYVIDTRYVCTVYIDQFRFIIFFHTIILQIVTYINTYSYITSTRIPSIAEFVNSTTLKLKYSTSASPFNHISNIASRLSPLNGSKIFRPINF